MMQHTPGIRKPALLIALTLLASGALRGDPVEPTFKHVPYGPEAQQYLNFWQAPSDKPTPVIVNIHGGAWRAGELQEVIVAPLLDEGVSYCHVEYRLVNKGGKNRLPIPVADATRAIQFLRSKAGEWNIDKNRILLTGGSAGGCTSLWIAFHDDVADPEADDPVLRESSRVQGAVLVNAQTTIDPHQIDAWIGAEGYSNPMFWQSVDAKSAADLMENWDQYQELSLEYSPITHLDVNDPPVYLIYEGSLKLPPDSHAHAIHHPMFGVKLKEQADAIGYKMYLSVQELPEPEISSEAFTRQIVLPGTEE